MLLLEGFSWSVRFVMEETIEPVQSMDDSGEKLSKSKRSQADKVGKLKYLLQKDQKLDRDIAEIKLMLRVIFAGMKHSLHFEKSLIEEAACEDEADREILQLLFEAGPVGLLPKDLAARLFTVKVRRFQVSRRIVRMNKRLMKELGEVVVERRGWRWAMTSFAMGAYGSNAEDLQLLDGFQKIDNESSVEEKA